MVDISNNDFLIIAGLIIVAAGLLIAVLLHKAGEFLRKQEAHERQIRDFDDDDFY